MASTSPALPALRGRFDMQTSYQNNSDLDTKHAVEKTAATTTATTTRLPSIASLTTSTSPPGSPISPASASSGEDTSRDDIRNSSAEASNSSFNSDASSMEEAMDTRGPESPPRREATAAPTWTNRWAGRAPPPKPLARASLATTRRHHPYAPTAAAMSSPTWPAHIGIDDGSSQTRPRTLPDGTPHSAGFFDGAPSTSFRLPPRQQRLRSTTVVVPPPHHGEQYPGQQMQRPDGPLRHNSYGTGVEKERPSSVSSAAHLMDHRRSRGDSFATSDSSHSYTSTLPTSPLLFAPLSPNDGVSPPYGYPSTHPAHQHMAQKSHAGAMGHQRFAPPGHQSPHVIHAGYEESPKGGSLYMSPHYEHMKRLQQMQPRPPPPPPPSTGQLAALHGRVEQWRGAGVGAAADGPPAPVNQASSPPLERATQSRRRRRPPYSYSSLIAQAISSSPQGRLTLREIYTWISNAYPELYSMDGIDSQGWQNTVRHNLSLNKSFVKVARTAQEIYDGCASANPAHNQAARGKGGWWTIDPVVAQAQLGPNFRGTGGETSPTETTHSDGRRREGSAEGSYSDGDYFPSPVGTPGYNMDPSWPRGVPAPAATAAAAAAAATATNARRGSDDSAVEASPAGVSGYPPGYPSVLMQPTRPRPSSMDQGALLGYDQHPPSFRRSRGYSNVEYLKEQQQQRGRALYHDGAAGSRPMYLAVPPHSAAAAAGGGERTTLAPMERRDGRLLDVPRSQKMDVDGPSQRERDLTPKAGGVGGGVEDDATPQAEERASGRMAISDILC